MTNKSDVPKTFSGKYYDKDYFVTPEGKKYKGSDGEVHGWSYGNVTGDWDGAYHITKAWKEVFGCKTLLDVGAGRGVFIAYARTQGIEAVGFDYSEYAVNEGRFIKCEKSWLIEHDATKRWPYIENRFDLVVALDFYEHIYEEDLDKVIPELFRVAKKYIFLEIATVGSGGLQGEKGTEGYVLKKGEPVPEDLEGMAVAGHVTVRSEAWWMERLEHDDWIRRRDMENHFISLCPTAVLANWVQNSIIILERLD